MKKKFPCGHVGNGKFCHRCAQEEKRTQEEEERKREHAKNKHDWGERISLSPVRLDHLPIEIAKKSLQVINKLNNGGKYQVVQGKRLVAMGKRHIISIRIGQRYRLICRESQKSLDYVEVIMIRPLWVDSIE